MVIAEMRAQRETPELAVRLQIPVETVLAVRGVPAVLVVDLF
jgi:hypothetical protein